MGIVRDIQAFCIRKFSSTYKRESQELKEITSFTDLAAKVTADTNKYALLAIQDFAYKTCKERMVSLKEGKEIFLIDDEEAVGKENCLLGQAECMKEIYIQVKCLRHKIKTRDEIIAKKENSVTFKQLNTLGKLSELHDTLLDKTTYNNLDNQLKEAYLGGLRVKLQKKKEMRGQDIHQNQKSIENDPTYKELQKAIDCVSVYYGDPSMDEDPHEKFYPDYSDIKNAWNLLLSNSKHRKNAEL